MKRSIAVYTIFIAVAIFILYQVIQLIQNNASQDNSCTRCFEGKIQQILDPDTLLIEGRLVSLSLIDTTHNNKQEHDDALSLTSKLCKTGDTAFVELDRQRFYFKSARETAQVTCSGKILNEELLLEGYGKIIKENCARSLFAKTSWAQNFGC